MRQIIKFFILMNFGLINLIMGQTIFEKGTLIVKFKEIENIKIEGNIVSGKNKMISKILQEHSLIKEKTIGNNELLYLFKFPEDQPLNKIITKLKNEDEVLYVSFNHGGKVSSIPNDPLWASQWAFQKINLHTAWNFVTGENDVLIGVLDSGIDYNHVDLSANISSYGWDFVDYDNDPQDIAGQANYHGTRVSGIIGGHTNNYTGIAGIASGLQNLNGAKIVPLRIVDTQGFWYESRIIDALTYLNSLKNSTNSVIANMSIQTLYHIDEINMLSLPSTINALKNNGVIMVAAAGNTSIDPHSLYTMQNVNQLPIPARYDGVFAIGASKDGANISNELRAQYSLYDVIDVAKLLIVAPVENNINSGINVYTTYSSPLNSYTNNFNGTSAAAPMVTGTIALMKNSMPCLTYEDIKSILKNSSVKIGGYSYNGFGRNIEVGYGRLDAAAAVQAAINQLPLSITINGNAFLQRGQTQSYTAIVTGDSGPFEFQWYKKNNGSNLWIPYGTNQSVSFTMINNNFQIKVEVARCQYFGESLKSIYLAGGNGGFPKIMANDKSSIPNQFSLGQNHPNPFNPTTIIKYELPEASSVSFTIYDIRGNEVKSWVNSKEQPGHKQMTWDATDSHGSKVPAGIYIYKLTATSQETNKVFSKSKKMVLMK